MLPGALTPPLQAHLSRLGGRLSFAEAARELGQLKGVTVSAASARRRTEADGRRSAALEAARAAALLAEPAPPPPGPAVQQVSVDGAMVPLADGRWREARTLAIGTVRPGRGPGTTRCAEVSYFSRMVDATAFALAATGEVHRRGVETAGVVAGVVDGADWCQAFLDTHRPDAVRILDFPHAVEHLTSAAQAAFGVGGERAAAWIAAQAQTLKRGDPMAVLLALLDLPVRAAPDPQGAAAARRATLRYLAARWEHIQYARFLAAGDPIGDGAIESANKRVPLARLKGSGMRWERASVNPMLALRTVAANDRWAEAWPQLRAHTRALTAARRQARRASAVPPPATPARPLPYPAPPSPRAPRRTGAIPALPPERARRPHPWSYQARLNARSLPDRRATN